MAKNPGGAGRPPQSALRPTTSTAPPSVEPAGQASSQSAQGAELLSAILGPVAGLEQSAIASAYQGQPSEETDESIARSIAAIDSNAALARAVYRSGNTTPDAVEGRLKILEAATEHLLRQESMPIEARRRAEEELTRLRGAELTASSVVASQVARAEQEANKAQHEKDAQAREQETKKREDAAAQRERNIATNRKNAKLDALEQVQAFVARTYRLKEHFKVVKNEYAGAMIFVALLLVILTVYSNLYVDGGYDTLPAFGWLFRAVNGLWDAVWAPIGGLFRST